MLRKLFVRWHGEGEAHQLDLYRCMGCRRIVTWNMIRSGERCCAGRLAPTNPTFWETLGLFLAPWRYR